MASGHLDEVQELVKLSSDSAAGGDGERHAQQPHVGNSTACAGALRWEPGRQQVARCTSHAPRHCCVSVATGADSSLKLTERELLGEGAFSRVSEVVEQNSSRAFALKRMTKTAALQCPEHVYCEQFISKNTANAFCIRQYASFKVCGCVGRWRVLGVWACWCVGSVRAAAAAACTPDVRSRHLTPACALLHASPHRRAGQAPPVLPV
jgi:hypothetical protein